MIRYRAVLRIAGPGLHEGHDHWEVQELRKLWRWSWWRGIRPLFGFSLAEGRLEAQRLVDQLEHGSVIYPSDAPPAGHQ